MTCLSHLLTTFNSSVNFYIYMFKVNIFIYIIFITTKSQQGINSTIGKFNEWVAISIKSTKRYFTRQQIVCIQLKVSFLLFPATDTAPHSILGKDGHCRQKSGYSSLHNGNGLACCNVHLSLRTPVQIPISNCLKPKLLH